MSERALAGDGRGRRFGIVVLAALLLIESSYVAYPWVRDLVLQREESETARGRREAALFVATDRSASAPALPAL